MPLGVPPGLAALAAIIRDLLDPASTRDRATAAAGAARQVATVVVGAAEQFAPTSYARARLIRQMHAGGLLTDEQARATEHALLTP